MIKIHKEGYLTLAIVAMCLLLLNVLVYFLFSEAQNVRTGVGIFSFILFLAVASFFRIPRRRLHNDDNLVIAPADGKIVTIEEVFEPEYFKDRRIQVSIFMSPANVHVNRSPISGRVAYTKYHPGNYLVAWHPKSSTENERFTSVIVDEEQNFEILVRQIAGKVARKISNYLQVGEEIEQGNELGFIKFGSRVDIFLPLETSIKVSLKQKVVGGKTILAELPADD